MQLNDLHELVSRLKENKGMQVETTTLGRFLGSQSSKVAFYLGREFLNRPVIVSTMEDRIQILDIHSGIVVVINNLEEMLPKVIESFSKTRMEKPKSVSSVEDTREMYQKIIKREIRNSAISQQLCEFREIMYKPGSLEDRLSLIERTIEALEKHKAACDNGEMEKIEKAQDKLGKLITHAKSKRLAPGQIPSVYEIAIWCWVN